MKFLNFIAILVVISGIFCHVIEAVKSYPPELRARLVYQHVVLRRSVRFVCRYNAVSAPYVRNVVNRWVETGTVLTTSELYGTLAGRHSVVTDEDIEIISDIINLRCVVNSKEIARILRRVGGSNVSPGTIRYWLRVMGYNSRSVWRYSRSASHVEEMVFFRRLRGIQLNMNQFVFIDESHVDGRNFNRLRGWALRGRRPVFRYLYHRGTRYSVIAALNQRGIIDYQIIRGSL